MVEKLGLQRIPHPYPYRVSWLNKEKHALISEQVWIQFQIGEYKDKILCDVTKMDAFHFILGGPWKYNVDARHDGKKKIYSITKGGETYTMRPLPNDGSHRVTNAMMVGGKEFS